MGRHCGFEFYRLEDGKFIKANVVENPWHNNELKNWLQIDSRCDATTIFLTAVTSKEGKRGWLTPSSVKPGDRYTAFLLLNHPELDGYSIPLKIDEYNKEYEGWVKKYFYMEFKKFKSLFDFDKAQQEHNTCIKKLKKDIKECQMEIKEIRKHQENAQTKAAFDGFEEKINDIKEYIEDRKEEMQEIEEDDYDYDHYMWIKEYLEKIDQLMKEDESLIVVAFAND